MSSSVPAQRLALVLLLRGLFPDAGVTYGRPVTLRNRMAWLGDARVTENVQPGTSGASRRSRRETVEVEVVLSCYVAGPVDQGDDAQMQATVAAYAMYDALEDHFRTLGVEPLAPGCMASIISSHDMTISPATDFEDVVRGWTCDITATVSTTATV